MSIVDDKSPRRVDDTTTPCRLQHTDDIIQSRASLLDVVDNDVAADNDDDDRPRDSDPAGGAFPVKPPQHTVAASCPPSPESDVERTSAEGRTCDGDEQDESDDNTMTSSS